MYLGSDDGKTLGVLSSCAAAGASADVRVNEVAASEVSSVLPIPVSLFVFVPFIVFPESKIPKEQYRRKCLNNVEDLNVR
jgi:hypothetical protein